MSFPSRTANADRMAIPALIAGSMIVLIALGVRQSFGLFLSPVTQALPGVNRESFGLAVALHNVVWGIGQPFAGMASDRYGSARVLFIGGLLYAGGLTVASYSSGPAGLLIGLGVMVGLGLSATSYAVVLGAVGRRFTAERRSAALGLVTLGGSIGIFLSVPFVLRLISNFGWSIALIGLAMCALFISLLCPIASGRVEFEEGPAQSVSEAVSEAFRHRGFVLLTCGFFACGFQLAFIATHLPAYLEDQHLARWLGAAALAAIGGSNVAGIIILSLLGDRVSKKNILTALYCARGLFVFAFISITPSNMSVLIFSAAIGFTWLGTVPLTSGIVGQIFGARHMSTLVGVIFFMHQLGSFLGAWVGGFVYENTGSYKLVWWIVIGLSALAALLHWPIDECDIQADRRALQ